MPISWDYAQAFEKPIIIATSGGFERRLGARYLGCRAWDSR